MRKDKLYTANKHNASAFAKYLDRENQNIFDGWDGSLLPNWYAWDNQYVNPSYKGGIPPYEVGKDKYPIVGLDLSYTPFSSVSPYSHLLPQQPNLSVAPNSRINFSDPNGVANALDKASKLFDKSNTGIDIQKEVATAKPAKPAKTPFLQSKLGQAVGIAASMVPDEWYDKLDPLYHLAGGKESEVGNTLGTVGKGVFKAGAASGNAKEMLVGAGLKVGGDVWNILGGTKANKSAIDAQNKYINQANLASKAISTALTISDFRDKQRLAVSNPGFDSWKDFYSDGPLTNRGRNKGSKLLKQGLVAGAAQTNATDLALNNINKIQGDQTYLSSFANGGFLDYAGIDPSTAIGYGLMSDYLTDKMVKRQDKLSSPLAGVSPNVLAIGGDLQAQGGDWSTGARHIDAGGTHEENPYDGVQVGVDPEGKPNLVEEGEIIYNDYVYSKRIKLDDEAKRKLHFPKRMDLTYADAAKRLEKEVSERPNDPISTASFKVQMASLAEEQERQKAEMQADEAREAFAQLSPEEQVAVMQQVEQGQQVPQEQMMPEQMPLEEMAMAQQEMPQQEAPLMDMSQQYSPQDIAAMQSMPQGQPVMAYGGYANKYPDGGKVRNSIMKVLNAYTWGDFADWAEKNNLRSILKDFKYNDNSAWLNLIQNKDFLNALSKGSSSLAHAIGSGYNFDTYKPTESGDIIKIGTPGQWTSYKFDDWYVGGDKDKWDPMFAELMATKGEGWEPKDRKEFEQALMGTKAYQDTSKWLENSDNARAYLKAILDSKDAPTQAKEWARSFINEDGTWVSGKENSTYQDIFGKHRTTYPGTYWKTALPAVRPNVERNYVLGKNGWEEVLTDIPKDWTKDNSYTWGTKDGVNTYNYYTRPDVAAAAAETAKEEEAKRRILPLLKDESMRYAGLAGPLVALGMMGAGIGKPDFDVWDRIRRDFAGSGPHLATYEPIGNYAKYMPLDYYAQLNRLTSEGRATDRAITSSTPVAGSMQAGLLANGRNLTAALGEAERKSAEADMDRSMKTLAHNSGIDQYNSTAFNHLSQFNAGVLNDAAKTMSTLGLQTEQQKAEQKAGWYNALYGNVDNLFKGISDYGLDVAQDNMLRRLIATGALGNGSPENAMFAGLVDYEENLTDKQKRRIKKGGFA